jgi:hypothetical protein
VVDALAAPYYPGDIAASLGSLLAEFGAPAGVPNDPLLAAAKYPHSPGYPGHATFGASTAGATPISIASGTSDASAGGGDANGTISNLAIEPAGSSKAPPATSAKSLVDVGNISATNKVVLNAGTIADTSTAQVDALDIAGLVNIANLTSTANATSDGTTGTPTATLHLGQVTVDGESAYIDATGVHINTTSSSTSGITPAQLQQTVNGTLAQDGISLRVLNPVLTTNGAQAEADAGGLQISIAHQIDVPFIPGEPTIPVPDLGNAGLPAGLYSVTTSITFGLAQASVNATSLAATIAPLPITVVPLPLPIPAELPSTSSGFESFGTPSSSDTFVPESVQASGPGSVAAALPVRSVATDFPVRGVPAPLGWVIAILLGCLIMCYPLLLLARWQFLAPRRR